MNKRSSASARVLATLALVAGFVVAIVMIGSVGDGEDSTTSDRQGQSGQVTRTSGGEQRTPATYVVESGDTLTSIARETGVSVARIQVLNPEVDPQILISGETLKLR
jgi:LysM repeat protein